MNNTNNEINRWWETESKKFYGGISRQKEPTHYRVAKGVNIFMQNDKTPENYIQRIEGVDYNQKKEWHSLLKASFKFLNDAQYKAIKLQLNTANSLLMVLDKEPRTFFIKDLEKGFKYKIISKVLELAPTSKKEHLKEKYDALMKKIKGGQVLDLSYNIKIVGKNKEVTLSNQSVTQVTQRLLKLTLKGTLEVLEYQKIGRYEIPAVISYKNDRIYISIN